jgi:hypothetical protein
VLNFLRLHELLRVISFPFGVSSACLRVSLSVSLFESSLFHAADVLAIANARIASLEAELEASQKAWDVATAAKVTAEKTAKAAATKAKKAEKALADTNQGRIQREEAITERLNQILALAGGEYFSTRFIVCLLILLMFIHWDFYFRALGSLVVLSFFQLLSFSSVFPKPLSETLTRS